jgi:cytochrome c peroxidase
LKTTCTIVVLFIFCIGLTQLISCRKEQNTKGITLIPQEIPAGFPAPRYTFSDNPLSQEGFELGRKLFYDRRLSIDNEHPCSSCHEQRAGFGTFEHDRSHGVNNSHTLRNAPVLFNLAWNSSFEWDGRFGSLSDQAAQEIHNPINMGESFAGIIHKLQEDEEYREAFKKVFRYPYIRTEDVLKALNQFTGYLVSANSKYDKVQKGAASFTVKEANGYQVFKTKCATCHPEPLFTDHSFRNIGLPIDPFLNDFGRMRVTNKREDSLKFKVPTLRNCYISSNYMHDGRFGTLGQCIQHYRTGVQAGPTLDPSLQSGISMTDGQADDLYDFLKTLTDSSFLVDPRFRQL